MSIPFVHHSKSWQKIARNTTLTSSTHPPFLPSRSSSYELYESDQPPQRPSLISLTNLTRTIPRTPRPRLFANHAVSSALPIVLFLFAPFPHNLVWRIPSSSSSSIRFSRLFSDCFIQPSPLFFFSSVLSFSILTRTVAAVKSHYSNQSTLYFCQSDAENNLLARF